MYFPPSFYVNRVLWRRLRAAAASAALCGAGIAAGVERMTAGAGRDRVRVADSKSAAHEGVDVVNFSALQVHRAEIVDQQLDAFGFDNLVTVLGGLLDRHAVLQSGAAARRHKYAQSMLRRALLGQKALELGHSLVRNRNHSQDPPRQSAGRRQKRRGNLPAHRKYLPSLMIVMRSSVSTVGILIVRAWSLFAGETRCRSEPMIVHGRAAIRCQRVCCRGCRR